MKINEIKFNYGENAMQNAAIEPNDKMIDYETSANLTYINILSILKGLSPFKDIPSSI